MDYLNWELTILSRAVAYSNLSSAASNIGLSQPQISRIVSKIESDLGVILLDRDAKRKAAWTPIAYRITEAYAHRETQLKADLTQLIDSSEPTHIRIACLDGLMHLAIELSNMLIKAHPAIEVLELNLHDLSILEERFLKGDYDFIFSSREPGRKKFNYRKQMGFQNLDVTGKGDYEVLSTFEFNTHNANKKHQHKKPGSPTQLVSNALVVRQIWIDQCGGRGTTPSPVRAKRTARDNTLTVWLIGNDQVPRKLWQEIAR